MLNRKQQLELMALAVSLKNIGIGAIINPKAQEQFDKDCKALEKYESIQRRIQLHDRQEAAKKNPAMAEALAPFKGKLK